MPLVAGVLIDGPSELIFDYEVPEELALAVLPGARVRVPISGRKATGTVTSVDVRESLLVEKEGKSYTIRPLIGLINEQPPLTPGLLALMKWMAEYYYAPLEQVMRSVLPASVRAEKTGFKSRKVVILAKEPVAEELEALEKKAPKQAAVLEQLLAEEQPVLLSELPADAVKALVKKGWVRLAAEKRERDPDEGTEFLATSPLALSEGQTACLAEVAAAIAAPDISKPLLLFGVTGSGKTEVYLQAVQAALDAGKTALVLVPEISLTPQTVERFKARFAHLQNEVAVQHSHLSAGERHDEWQRIARGGAKIVIGARSALFAPLNNLGLIVVDEEHEHSYKQDSVPRYHARDLAIVRAKLEKCAIVLGSATPSLETWHNAQQGRYTLLSLKERADKATLPVIRVIDLRTEKSRSKGAPLIFSEPLRIAMTRRLEEREQMMLFLNRRGYAGSIQCPSCGHVVQCQHCAVSLVYHQERNVLSCHLCGFQRQPIRKCPSCQDPAIRMAGFGTERVEETLKKIFPTIKAARLDADTLQRKNTLKDTLSAFKARKLDVLIGTQMIAKGLHFPSVTLVGILHADLGLHVPDFRAGERTFQLLTQVAGRAGRGEKPGEVIVQTFTPHHPSIQFARHGDYEGYAAQEMEFRHALGFPPSSHAVLLGVRSEKENLAEFTLKNIHHRLQQGLPEGILLGEPAPSPLERAESQFRYQLLLLSKHTPRITTHLRSVLTKMTFPKEVTVLIDVDPMTLS